MRYDGWLALRQALEAIPAPAFAAHAIVNEEQAIRIIFRLDGGKARVVRAPIGILPVDVTNTAGPAWRFKGDPINITGIRPT